MIGRRSACCAAGAGVLDGYRFCGRCKIPLRAMLSPCHMRLRYVFGRFGLIRDRLRFLLWGGQRVRSNRNPRLIGVRLKPAGLRLFAVCGGAVAVGLLRRLNALPPAGVENWLLRTRRWFLYSVAVFDLFAPLGRFYGAVTSAMRRDQGWNS